jgi:phenylacetate-coenzyme A ligase PaaK-like adenylate-forming protein
MFGLDGFDLEAVYRRLPIPLQHVGCSLVGWRTERTRYAHAFQRILEDAVVRTYWSAGQLEAFRDRRLIAHVRHAVRTSSFYGGRFCDAGLVPTEVRSMADLASLPILTKAEAQELAAELSSSVTPTGETRMAHTSGTTGGALRFRVTMAAIREQWAIWWRYRSWHGIRKGTWCALLAGRSVVPATQTGPPFWRVNYPGRQVLFSGYHMSPQNLSTYVRELRRRRPSWLHGYPSLLALVASHLLESGADLGYDVRWVTTGAENVLPQQAAVIERALGVRPIQHYGLAEGAANISQCELGSLHVDEDFSAVEFIPLGQDGLHKIVGTNFTNPATPLLRYDTQDLAVLRDGASCECGRAGRIVERVDGRLEDYVILRNGVRVGRMDHVFKDMVNVREAQIHQARRGEITLRVVRGEAYGGDDEQVLLRETVKRVGAETKIAIEYWDALPRSPTGKLRFVLSDLAEASIEELPAAPA